MKSILRFLALSILLVGAATGVASAQIGPGPFAAFPSGSTTDARFMGFACTDLAAIESGTTMGLSAPAAPAGTTTFLVNVFDGDTGALDGAGKAHWDLGARPLRFSLYADPFHLGSTTPANLIGSWTGNGVNPLTGPNWAASAATMPDNAWWALAVTNSAAAQAPSGNYFYTLIIDFDTPCIPGDTTESNIKIAASNPMNFNVPKFGLVAALRQLNNDGPIVYPGLVVPVTAATTYLDLPTTYDGSFEFFLNVPDNNTELNVFDGDLDLGTATPALNTFPSGLVLPACADTDDPNTLTDYSDFPFTPGIALFEGAAGPGNPNDDNRLDAFRRGEIGSAERFGCIRYEVSDPLGNIYRNDNPSGNREWERFRIASALATNPGTADALASTDTLPGGVWKVKTVGHDMSNLTQWFVDACAGRPAESGGVVAACNDKGVYLLGDTVWYDLDGDGTQDTGEPGIKGVKVDLIPLGRTDPVFSVLTGDDTAPDWAACVLHNTGLDTNGLYCLGVGLPGVYTARVSPDNFLPGGVLAGSTATTAGGNEQTNTVVANNVLTYDFGYIGSSTLGDYVWYDANSDADQDEPVSAGLTGVKVNLREFGPDQLFDTTDDLVFPPQTTNANGSYLFTQLLAGTYRVDVDESTLPIAGLTLTTGNEPLETPLGGGEDFLDADFGYVRETGLGSIGDTVWTDSDGNGVQNGAEAGINGVSLKLEGDLDGDGDVDLVQTTVTATDGPLAGQYSFTELPPGSYTVTVDGTTLPAGYTQTKDLDGLDTPSKAKASLTAAQDRTDFDFGYRPPSNAALGDRVWIDQDGDGFQDVGETGINGVTVQLLNSSGGVITSTVTSGDGNYGFTNLAAGTYSVRVVASTLPAGLVQTYDLDTTTTPHIATVTLTAGQVNNNVDFGYRGSASLGDRVWNDSDGDGMQDGGEAGLNGVTVKLLNSSNVVIATAVTSGNGNYTFANLQAGTYKVQVDSSTLPAGFAQTYDLDGTATAHIATATLTAAQNRVDVDFGYRAPVCTPDAFTALTGNSAGSGSVGNIRTFTSTQGVQVKASAWSRRDSDGLWTKAFLGAFSGGLGVTSTVEGSGANDSHTLDNVGGEHEVILLELSAPVILDKAYLGYIATASGYGDSDLTVAIGTATDPFNNHITLNDTFVYGLSTYEDNDTSSSAVRWADVNAGNVSGNVIIIAASASDTSPDDGFKLQQLGLGCPGTTPVTYSVGDRVWSDTDGDGAQDTGEAGLNGVTVELLNAGGTVVATQATSGNGNYTFSNLAAGTYKVRVVTSTVPSGVTQTYDLDGTGTAHIATFTLNANRTDVDFGYRPAVCTPEAFPTFGGSDSESGTAGNIKTFTTSSGVKVKVSGWSRKKSTGAWASAYLGAYGGGLGVTDGVSDGTGSSNQHTTDNNGADNYLLFEFDRAVVVEKVSQGYVVTDSDLTAWFGDAPGSVNPYTTHQTLSTAFLSGLTTQTSDGGSSTRTADLNSGGVSGNVLIVAAKTDGANNTTTDFSNDYFKLNNVTLACGGGSTPTTPIAVRGKASAGTTTKTLTINKPSGTAQNDVMIASIAFRTNEPGVSTDVAITAPSGWTLVRRLDNTNSTSNGLAVYRKVAGSSEPTTYTWTFVGSGSCNTHGFQAAVGGVVSFVNVDTTNPINVEKGVNTSAGAQTASSVTTTVANTMLVASFGTANGDTWAPPSGMTEQVDTFAANEMIGMNTATQAAAGATGSKTATDNGPAALDAGNAHILALRPKP